MSIKYHVVARKNPQKPEEEPRFYPSIKSLQRVTTSELADYISDRSTLHQIDVIAMLTALMDAIPDLLMDGCVVELGELGSFQPKIRGRSADSANKVTKYYIKELYPRFVPSKRFKAQFKKASFHKITPKKKEPVT